MKKLPSGSFFCCQEFTVIAYLEQAAVKFRQIILRQNICGVFGRIRNIRDPEGKAFLKGLALVSVSINIHVEQRQDFTDMGITLVLCISGNIYFLGVAVSQGSNCFSEICHKAVFKQNSIGRKIGEAEKTESREISQSQQRSSCVLHCSFPEKAQESQRPDTRKENQRIKEYIDAVDVYVGSIFSSSSFTRLLLLVLFS